MREEYLDPEYLPEILPHRENEIEAVFEMLRPVAEGRKPVNVFIYGPAGIGKTAVAKFVLRKFEEEGVRGVYINCWYFRTEGAIITEFLRQLNIPVPRKGRSVDELVREFMNNVEGEKIVVVLDEIDAVESEKVLYEMSRCGNLGIVLISNDPYAFRKFDQRIISSLAPHSIEFRRYGVDEIYDILKERARIAGLEYEEEAMRVAARFTYMHGSDIRYGLLLLLRAGRLAEGEGEKLKIEHLKKVEVEENPKREMRKEELGEEHKKIIRALELMGGEASSGEVYRKYRKIGGLGAERTFRKYVSELIKLGMIKAEESVGRGRTRILKL